MIPVVMLSLQAADDPGGYFVSQAKAKFSVRNALFNGRNLAGIALIVGAFTAPFALTACSTQPSPCCVAYPAKSFKAVYECKLNDNAPFKQIWQSNGKGLMRLTVTGEKKDANVTVIDYHENNALSLVPTKKLALQRQLETPWISNATADQADAESLGSKTIDGHPCVGWQVKNESGESEYWMGEDTGCYVQINALLPENSRATIKLVDYSADEQNPADFTVPSDFKVEKRPTKLSWLRTHAPI
jgi:hypothetical protein